MRHDPSVRMTEARFRIRETGYLALKLVGMPVRTAQVDIGTSSQVEIAAVETVRGSVHESASLTVSGESATVDVTESTSGRVIRTS